jgi:hypothetical protein
MHMHMLVGIVLHTTLLAIVGYALLFSASKASGVVALIGRVLGLWVFALAILSVAAVVTAPMFGGKPFGMEMMHDHGGWMHHGDHDGDRDGDRGEAPDQRVTPPPQATQPTPPPPAPTKP